MVYKAVNIVRYAVADSKCRGGGVVLKPNHQPPAVTMSIYHTGLTESIIGAMSSCEKYRTFPCVQRLRSCFVLILLTCRTKLLSVELSNASVYRWTPVGRSGKLLLVLAGTAILLVGSWFCATCDNMFISYDPATSPIWSIVVKHSKDPSIKNCYALAADPEVRVRFPALKKFSEKYWVWNRVHSASLG
jgi:hypothetical protein